MLTWIGMFLKVTESKNYIHTHIVHYIHYFLQVRHCYYKYKLVKSCTYVHTSIFVYMRRHFFLSSEIISGKMNLVDRKYVNILIIDLLYYVLKYTCVYE